jgi:hypothetical protein
MLCTHVYASVSPQLTLVIVTLAATASDRACAPEGCVTQAVTQRVSNRGKHFAG